MRKTYAVLEHEALQSWVRLRIVWKAAALSWMLHSWTSSLKPALRGERSHRKRRWIHSFVWSCQGGNSHQPTGGVPQLPKWTPVFGGHCEFRWMQGTSSTRLVQCKAKHWNICKTLENIQKREALLLCVSGSFALPKFLPNLEICLLLPWMVLLCSRHL